MRYALRLLMVTLPGQVTTATAQARRATQIHRTATGHERCARRSHETAPRRRRRRLARFLPPPLSTRGRWPRPRTEADGATRVDSRETAVNRTDLAAFSRP